MVKKRSFNTDKHYKPYKNEKRKTGIFQALGVWLLLLYPLLLVYRFYQNWLKEDIE